MSEFLCTHCSPLIVSAGLLLDIAGVALVWRFGIPESVNREGHSTLVIEGNDASEIRKAGRYDRLTYCGLLLLMIGFALQLAGAWL